MYVARTHSLFVGCFPFPRLSGHHSFRHPRDVPPRDSNASLKAPRIGTIDESVHRGGFQINSDPFTTGFTTTGDEKQDFEASTVPSILHRCSMGVLPPVRPCLGLGLGLGGWMVEEGGQHPTPPHVLPRPPVPSSPFDRRKTEGSVRSTVEDVPSPLGRSRVGRGKGSD
eukprot:scaffold752_cov322-Pavlova_lutheri.AAC.6